MKKLIVVIITLFSVITGKTQVSEQNSLALVAIYNSTNGTNWYYNHGWLANNFPVGEWEGVTIRSNRVVSLVLGFNNLSGNIPAEIGDLDSLSFLDLSGSNILGLSQTYGNISSLELPDCCVKSLSEYTFVPIRCISLFY